MQKATSLVHGEKAQTALAECWYACFLHVAYVVDTMLTLFSPSFLTPEFQSIEVKKLQLMR